MTVRIYIPRDSAALAVGAERVVKAFQAEIMSRKLDAVIVRNGSRGMHWLEVLVEIETSHGRIAYGPVTAKDVSGLLGAGMLDGMPHPLCQGLTEEIPFLKNQTRLTFSRCGITDPLSLDDYRSLGGLVGLERSLTISGADVV